MIPGATIVKSKPGTGFFARATWQARSETPDELAERFVRQIDLLQAFDPRFALWTCGARRPTRYENMRDRYAQEVAAGLSRDDWGEPVPEEGYGFGAITRGRPPSQSYAMLVTDGAHMHIQAHQNYAQLSTSTLDDPEPGSVAYALFKLVLTSMVTAWAPLEVQVRPDALIAYITDRQHFEEPWMQYLAAPLASLVAPPDSALVERMPDGGLLMSATADTFCVDNPQHLAAAHDIARAIAPLNELPYVRDRGYGQ